MADYFYLDQLESHTSGNPIQLGCRPFHHRQKMVLSHGHLGTNKRFESGQSLRHAQPHPLDQRRHVNL
jgi:hypothetical protein